jgi:ubiquinone/menaquinone biosynthesis C-methylase UbiE
MEKINGPEPPHHQRGGAGRHRGHSSYRMHDPEIIFGELDLKAGDVFLDLGCGTGDYSVRTAEEVGEEGFVYAMDIQSELVDALMERAASLGLENLSATTSDIFAPMPFEDRSIDVVLISTVLHSVDLNAAGTTLFLEIFRILKPGGRLFIIECKKEEMPFGPPLRMRLSPEEIVKAVAKFGFTKTGYVDLGYNYMLKFEPCGETR